MSQSRVRDPSCPPELSVKAWNRILDAARRLGVYIEETFGLTARHDGWVQKKGWIVTVWSPQGNMPLVSFAVDINLRGQPTMYSLGNEYCTRKLMEWMDKQYAPKTKKRKRTKRARSCR